MGGYRDFISHAGVKGMKWGVWNEETQKRYGGFGKTPKMSSLAKSDIPAMPGGGGGSDDDDDMDDAYEELLMLAQRSGNSKDFMKNLAESIYSATFKNVVDDGKEKAIKVLAEYKKIEDMERSLTEEERSELRKKAKEEKKRRKQESGGFLW